MTQGVWKHLGATLGQVLVLRTPGGPPCRSAPGTRLARSLARPNSAPRTRAPRPPPAGTAPRRDPETRNLQPPWASPCGSGKR